MTREKPDCTGQKFGYLTVLGKSKHFAVVGKTCQSLKQLWRLQCDCGKEIELVRQAFDRTDRRPQVSCGCWKKKRSAMTGMAYAKPDCTGQKFGYLTVLGKGDYTITNRGWRKQLWRLQCDCGNVIQSARSQFASPSKQKRVSCGCMWNRGKTTRNITGKKFGLLTAIKLSGNRDYLDRPAWLCQCECGAYIEYSLKRLNLPFKLHCGDAKHQSHLHYPPTPSPYPEAAGKLLTKYLYLTRKKAPREGLLADLSRERLNAEIEDEKRDRLIRACWILVYRRSRGEEFSPLHERNFLAKHLRYVRFFVYGRHRHQSSTGFYTTVKSRKQKQHIGTAVTNTTPLNYPVIETPEITLCGDVQVKKVRFRRC